MLAGLGIMFGAHAQFPMAGGPVKPKVTGRITALILDSVTKKPVDYATISLVKATDSKAVNGGVTDKKAR